MANGDKINKRARIFAFSRLFIGIVWDFWREARLARRTDMRVAEARMAARHRKRAIQFRETAVRLGGVLIKLGQFFGSRVDVMPEPYIQELLKLQDEVPPEDYFAVKQLVEEDFGRPIEEIYGSFNPVPIAAASLAQVHEAFLVDGTKVAVKVQRPGIERLIDIDLATFSYLMEGVKRFTSVGDRFDITGLVEEFQKVLGEELDLARVADSARRFAADFRDRADVRVPSIYDDLSTDRVITMEYMTGVKINDYAGLDAAGIDRPELARRLVNIYISQFLETGFFHADPHPGNLFVSPGPVITFLDFGMMGEITAEDRGRFIDAVVAIVQKDPDEMIAAAVDLHFVRPGLNPVPLRNALNWLFDRYSGISTPKSISSESFDSIQEDIRALMRDNPFNIPVHFAYVGKAFATMIGLLAGLDANFDLIKEAKPAVDKLVREVRNEYILKQAKKIGLALLKLPVDLERAIGLAERGELRVKVAGQPELLAAMERQEAGHRRSLMAGYGGGAAIIATILFVNNYDNAALAATIVSGLLVTGSLVFKRRRPRFHP
jgi:predicted unusual protein kinase regulating ubiquinone biosynthesis (AarF/ABC1/UbiB family)